MDTKRLEPLMRRFVEAQRSDDVIVRQHQNHQRRQATASRLLVAQRIPDLTRQELQGFLQDTDAWYGLRWNKQEWWTEIFGERDERLPALRDTLAHLVRRAEEGLTAADFNHFLSLLRGIGPAYLSEILALRFPDRYWLWNKQIRDFFKANGVDIQAELPRTKKADEGERYMAAGRHLGDLRHALQQTLGQPVDYLLTDLFVYWANQQDAPDPWAEKIARLTREHFPPERAEARREGEGRARKLLADKLGHLTEEDLRQCLDYLNADWSKGRPCRDRFRPALWGHQVQLMAKTMPALNRWIKRLWTTADAELDALLDTFWREQEISGAGISLPTAVLYLRDPEKYSIWLPTMSKGLQVAAGLQPGPEHTASGYRQYNAAAVGFRRRYGLPPQALDLILWLIATDAHGDSIYTLDHLCRDTFLDVSFWNEVQALLQDKHQIVLYGPPGTGKTWLARHFARFWVDAAPEPGGVVQVVQFHPSYAYEDFVEGIRPESVPTPDGRAELTYRVKEGIFRLFCEQARQNPERRYVLILDEINRGELPRILGELLYLLEYRNQSVVLPYSGRPFSIPDNVYLIGTMNTADRSIALVDHALRRRFHFVDVRPNSEVLRDYLEAEGKTEMSWVADLLEEVNRQLEADGIEWHLHIGHSHFMRPDLDEARLRLIWKHSVLPTLEEYFYRQPERLKDYELQPLKERLGRA